MGCKDLCRQGRDDCPDPDNCMTLVRRCKSYPHVPPDIDRSIFTEPPTWTDKMLAAAMWVLGATLISVVGLLATVVWMMIFSNR